MIYLIDPFQQSHTSLHGVCCPLCSPNENLTSVVRARKMENDAMHVPLKAATPAATNQDANR